MRLKLPQPPTTYPFTRGLGLASIPDTGGGPTGGKLPSACWATKSDLLGYADLEYMPGKVFLGRVDDKLIGIDTLERHVVTIAGSRAGKTVCSLVPNLKDYPGSVLVIDPKGQLADLTAEDRRAMGQDVHVLDPWGVTKTPREKRAAYNPLIDLVDGPDEFQSDNAELIADALIIANEKDPHWTDSARLLIKALLLYMLDDGGALSRLPSMIARLAYDLREKTPAETEADDGAAGLVDVMADYAPDPAQTHLTGESLEVVRSAGLMLKGMGDKERASVFSTARTQTAFLEGSAMSSAVNASDFALADLKRRPTTIYLCLPASRMGTHFRWLRMIINLACAALEFEPTQPDALPVLFMLEEFAALGYMRSLENAVAYMGGFSVKLWMVLQDLTQLKRHYKESWETFLGNAGVIQAFNISDLTTCKYLSERLGNTVLQITNKQDVSSGQAMSGDTGLRREFREAPLIASFELSTAFRRRAGKGPPAGLTLVLVQGANMPFAIDRVFYGEIGQ